MNNPFHLAAGKAFRACVKKAVEGMPLPADWDDRLRKADLEFQAVLEAQGRAFDACKTGRDISVTALEAELNKSWWAAIKVLRTTRDVGAAQRKFWEGVRPHLEIRLW